MQSESFLGPSVHFVAILVTPRGSCFLWRPTSTAPMFLNGKDISHFTYLTIFFVKLNYSNIFFCVKNGIINMPSLSQIMLKKLHCKSVLYVVSTKLTANQVNFFLSYTIIYCIHKRLIYIAALCVVMFPHVILYSIFNYFLRKL